MLPSVSPSTLISKADVILLSSIEQILFNDGENLSIVP